MRYTWMLAIASALALAALLPSAEAFSKLGSNRVHHVTAKLPQGFQQFVRPHSDLGRGKATSVVTPGGKRRRKKPQKKPQKPGDKIPDADIDIDNGDDKSQDLNVFFAEATTDEVEIANANDKTQDIAGNGGSVIQFQPHVICKNNQFNTVDCPSPEIITKQIEVLNSVFGPHGFTFQPLPTNYKFDEALYNTTLMDEKFTLKKEGVEFFSELHQGDRRTLNVYMKPNFRDTDANLQGLTLMFPEELAVNPSWTDGIYILAGTLPGMTPFAGQFDQGITLVHEVGHWLGLRHIFTDACEQTDVNFGFQDDTPATTSIQVGCPESVPSSCKAQAGGDSAVEPTRNFMGYTSDSCRSEFTPNQVEVMKFVFGKLRSSSVFAVGVDS